MAKSLLILTVSSGSTALISPGLHRVFLWQFPGEFSCYLSEVNWKQINMFEMKWCWRRLMWWSGKQQQQKRITWMAGWGLKLLRSKVLHKPYLSSMVPEQSQVESNFAVLLKTNKQRNKNPHYLKTKSPNTLSLEVPSQGMGFSHTV